MLDKIRTFAQYKIVKWVFAIFLIIPFGLFGIDYYFRTPLGGDTIATVGKLRVSQGEFDQALRQQQETLQAQFGSNFDSSIMENPEVRRSVLDRARQRAPHRHRRREGRRAHRRQAARRAHRRRARLPGGRQVLQGPLRGHRPLAGLLAWSASTSACARTCASARYRDAIVQTTFVPRSTLDGFIRLSEQSREVSLVNVGPEAFLAAVKPTEAELKAYYDARASGVHGARAGARGVRRALARRAGRAHARRSGGREEVLRVQQVALRAARGAPGEPHPAHGEGGRHGGRAQGRGGEGRRDRRGAAQEARGVRGGGEEGIPGSRAPPRRAATSGSSRAAPW